MPPAPNSRQWIDFFIVSPVRFLLRWPGGRRSVLIRLDRDFVQIERGWMEFGMARQVEQDGGDA